MQWFTDTYLKNTNAVTTVLDVGSYDINGCYRPIFPAPQFFYTGLDITEGPNVDLAVQRPYAWQEIPDNAYDVVISGQTLGHMEFFWFAFAEMTRVLKPGGRLCLIVPRLQARHRHQIDCYRFDEDGLAALACYANLTPLHISMNLAPIGAHNWYNEKIGDAMLIAQKPLEWQGLLEAREYPTNRIVASTLHSGFVPKSAQPKPLPSRTRASDRINALATAFAAESYLEIGARDAATFSNVALPHKVVVHPGTLSVPPETPPASVRLFSGTSDEFFASPAGGAASVPRSSEPSGEPPAFDIIFIDGAHSFEQSFHDFEISRARAHRNTLWLIDGTVPCDPYGALPDREKCHAMRKQAGSGEKEWQGDVFKTIFAIHDRYPEYSYCTLLGNTPQTVVWKAQKADRTPLFASLQKIGRLSYFDMLDHAAVLMPIKDNALLDIVGKTLVPQDYGERDTWKKLVYRQLTAAAKA